MFFDLDLYLGLILILAWMYSTSELDELFRILISIKGFKLRQPQWSNTTIEDKGIRTKRSVVGSIFKWLFGGGDDGTETTKQLKNNIAISKQNQNLQQDQIKQLLKMSQLTVVETLKNRKLLKDLTKDMIQINFTVARLEYQSQQLYASVNFLNFMMTVRHKIAVIRDSTFAIQQNLNHLYIYLNTLGTHKLIPEMLTPYDLLALLETVVKDLRSHAMHY